jgi:hypothetical protein
VTINYHFVCPALSRSAFSYLPVPLPQYLLFFHAITKCKSRNSFVLTFIRNAGGVGGTSDVFLKNYFNFSATSPFLPTFRRALCVPDATAGRFDVQTCNVFSCHASEKPVSNPFLCHTSKTLDLKPFICHTSEKRWGESGGTAVIEEQLTIVIVKAQPEGRATRAQRCRASRQNPSGPPQDGGKPGATGNGKS